MPEPEVHEIQLNGKQLVFMFGAAVVVSVVIFLCGVMVGRGVRQPQPDLLAENTSTPVDSTASLEGVSSRPAVPVEPTPAPERENLTYGNRLEAAAPLDEPLKPVQKPKPAVAPAVAEKPAVAPAVAEKPPVAPAVAEKPTVAPAVGGKPAPPPERASSKSLAEPPGNGHVVQVMAFPVLAEAEALARRLGAKGYPTFITNDGPARSRYRVRVGKYPNKRDAEAIALRLKQEERFEPWVPPR